MDMEQWICVGILARERWAGLNGETVIGRATRNTVVVPIPVPLIPLLIVSAGCPRNEPPPFKQEEIALEKLRLGNGEQIHIGYGEKTNSLWIRGSDLIE